MFCWLLFHLENLLQQWSLFDKSYRELNQWIKEMEITVKSNAAFRSTLEEKQQTVNENKVYVSDIMETK